MSVTSLSLSIFIYKDDLCFKLIISKLNSLSNELGCHADDQGAEAANYDRRFLKMYKESLSTKTIVLAY